MFQWENLLYICNTLSYFTILAADLKRAVRKNMHWLVQNMSPMDHLDYLFSYEALNREDYENIYAERTESSKVNI